MMNIRALFFSIISFFCIGSSCIAEPSITSNNALSLMFPAQSVKPGTEIEGIIRLTLEPGWHTYWKNPGGIGLTPAFDWELSSGITVKDIIWPTPKLLKQADTYAYGYENSPEWIVRLSFDKNLSANTYRVNLTAFFLTCDGMCTPITSQAEHFFTVSENATQDTSWDIAKKVTSTFPSPLAIEKGTLRKNSLFLQLPLSKEHAPQIQNIIVFPEKSALFSPGTKITWTQEETSLSLSIPLTAEGFSLLQKDPNFSGLIQIVQPESTETYSINTSLEYTLEPIKIPQTNQDLWKQKDVSQEKIFSTLTSSFMLILVAAFFGGLILNITPCVLPIVGLKMLHLLSLREKSNVFLHGVSYTFGILCAFWAMAGGLYFLGHIGETLGWGFQLQQPLFVAALILILFIFALNLFGLFEIGSSLAAWAGNIEGSLTKMPSYLTSFLSGLFATVIATPCTGPLLGSVLGFAATFQAKEGLFLFSSIGLGMAFPFLLVTIFPVILKILPRPGPWMIGLKQFFGFLMLGTVLWLLWVLSSEVAHLSLLHTASSFFLLAVGCWIFGRWGSLVRAWPIRFIASILSLAFLLLGIATFLLAFESPLTPFLEKQIPTYSTIAWKPYSKSALEMELRKGNTVFVHFSAKWCLTCQANEFVFLSPKVIEAFQQKQIVAFSADWTNGSQEITEMLRSLGRNGVPVYAIFKPGEEPLLLPEILTPEMLVTTIQSLTQPEKTPS